MTDVETKSSLADGNRSENISQDLKRLEQEEIQKVIDETEEQLQQLDELEELEVILLFYKKIILSKTKK